VRGRTGDRQRGWLRSGSMRPREKHPLRNPISVLREAFWIAKMGSFGGAGLWHVRDVRRPLSALWSKAPCRSSQWPVQEGSV